MENFKIEIKRGSTEDDMRSIRLEESDKELV